MARDRPRNRDLGDWLSHLLPTEAIQDVHTSMCSVSQSLTSLPRQRLIRHSLTQTENAGRCHCHETDRKRTRCIWFA